MFFSLYDDTHWWTSVLNHSNAIQDFIDEKVKDEVLPEDEKEKFKVHIQYLSCLLWYIEFLA
jgi:hypothetical protein